MAAPANIASGRIGPPAAAGPKRKPIEVATMNDEKSKNLDLAISQIEKQHGKGSIIRLGSKDVLVPVNVIPTGSISIDSALGIGGFPRGRVIEVYGPES